MAIKKCIGLLGDYTTRESRITDSFTLVNEMEHEVKKYTKLLQLAQADRINIIKDNVDYTQCLMFIDGAKKWHSMIHGTEKIDRRRKYTEKEEYDYFISMLKNDFFGDRDVEIIGFAYGGFDSYYIQVSVAIDTKTYALEIPLLRALNEQNYQYANCGKIALMVKTNPSCWCHIAASYKEEDIKKAFEEYHLKNNEEREKES